MLPSKNKKNILISVLFSIAALFSYTIIFSSSVLAQEGYQLLAEIPGYDKGAQAPAFPQYMQSLFTLVVGLSVVMAVIMIVIGGIQYVMAAVPSAKSEGKKRITGAILGLILAIFSYLILYTINPELVFMGLNLDKIDPTAYTAPPNTGGTNPPTNATGGNSLPCENIDAAKDRINNGGSACDNAGSCKSCNTSTYEPFILSSASKYGVNPQAIRSVIARESSCDPNPGSVDGKSCGLMQVTYPCSIDPETNIDQGARKLAMAYKTAENLGQNYGDIVTVHEVAYAIYNGGAGNSTASSDCQPSTGWPSMPKWACPVNPGSGKYNACFIRSNACGFGACF